MTKAAASRLAVDLRVRAAVARAASFPRLRYMGSKYKLVPQLAEVFAAVDGKTALDAFSGSGVAAYALKVSDIRSPRMTFCTFHQLSRPPLSRMSATG